MADPKNGCRFQKPIRWADLTPQQQLNLACSGDPDDDDGTQLLQEDDDEDGY